ncbi:MAG: helix-turn-helix domain-containing protein [Alphaproteobacteria bacterium]
MLSKENHKNNLKEFRNTFIENISRLLKEKNLSLEELSKQSQISQIEIDKIISGNYQNWGALHQLSRFLECKIKIVFY